MKILFLILLFPFCCSAQRVDTVPHFVTDTISSNADSAGAAIAVTNGILTTITNISGAAASQSTNALQPVAFTRNGNTLTNIASSYTTNGTLTIYTIPQSSIAALAALGVPVITNIISGSITTRTP